MKRRWYCYRRFFYLFYSVNILVVANKFPYPTKDGGQIATFAMIRGFYEMGNSVTVAAINTLKHYYDVSNLPDTIASIADFRSITVNTDLTVKDAVANLLFSRLPYTATRFINTEFSNLIVQILSEKKFDVVQLEGLYMCAYIPIIRQYSNAKISYRAHNVEFEIWKRLAVETKNFVKRLYLKNLTIRVERFEKSILNTYDFIVPITQRDAETYNAIGNTKLSFVAQTGIFINDLPQTHVRNDIVSLFHLGALDWFPNQQGLLWFLDNCWSQIRHQNPDLQLFVAGRNAPQWLIEKLNVSGVVYVGEVENAYDFMAQHTIMIVPLLAGGGMRIKILEGLAYGKVIVSTSIGAEGIAAENGKEICMANSPQEFINSILTIISSKDLQQNLSQNAVSFVRKTYNNLEIIQKLLLFYKQ